MNTIGGNIHTIQTSMLNSGSVGLRLRMSITIQYRKTSLTPCLKME